MTHFRDKANLIWDVADILALEKSSLELEKTVLED
jgi:hypothetical protein